VSECEFTRLVDRSVSRSLLLSLGRKLLCVFPLTNIQLDLMKRKMGGHAPATVELQFYNMTYMGVAMS